MIPVMKVRTREEEYDSLVGVWTRKVKENDILHIASIGSTQPGAAGDFTLASTTLDANHEALIHAFAFGSSSAADFAVVVGTSTILPTHLSGDGQSTPVAAEHILARVAPSTTISIIALGASTAVSYNGWLSALHQPIADKLETES